jgi:hypothetical protein
MNVTGLIGPLEGVGGEPLSSRKAFRMAARLAASTAQQHAFVNGSSLPGSTVDGCPLSQHIPNLPSTLIPISHRLSAGSVAVLGCLVAILVHAFHLAELRRGTQPSAYRGLYVVMSRLAPVLGVTECLAALAPNMADTLELVGHLYHALAMWGFIELLLLLVYRGSDGTHREMRSRARGSTDLAFYLDAEECAQTRREAPP